MTNSYNNMGHLTGQSGAGASAATTARSFSYDQAGNMTSASAPGGNDTFSYNDRGLLLSASGPSGSSSFSYNGDGQAGSVSDAAGTTSYGYDTAGRLATLNDPATGTTGRTPTPRTRRYRRSPMALRFSCTRWPAPMTRFSRARQDDRDCDDDPC
jgi:YD repeat-containing protein